MRTFVSIVAGVSVGIAGSVAAAVSVPYIFSSGQTASAAQVNGNFSALAAAIDALTSRVAVAESRLAVQDANGVLFGTNLSYSYGYNYNNNTSSPYAYVTALLRFGDQPVGFLVGGDFSTGFYSPLMYESSDCTGVPYMRQVSAFPTLKVDRSGQWYMTTPESTIVNDPGIHSAWDQGCSTLNTGNWGGGLAVASPVTTTQNKFLSSLVGPWKIVRTTSPVIVDVP